MDLAQHGHSGRFRLIRNNSYLNDGPHISGEICDLSAHPRNSLIFRLRLLRDARLEVGKAPLPPLLAPPVDRRSMSLLV